MRRFSSCISRRRTTVRMRNRIASALAVAETRSSAPASKTWDSISRPVLSSLPRPTIWKDGPSPGPLRRAFRRRHSATPSKPGLSMAITTQSQAAPSACTAASASSGPATAWTA